MNVISQLSDKIHSSYGEVGCFGLKFFEPFIEQIEQLGPVDFIHYQMANYDLRYVKEMFCSIPSILLNFKLTDWEKVISNAERRASCMKMYNDHGYFADIFFIIKYLNLNPLNFIKDSTEVSHLSKIEIFKYCKTYKGLLLADEIDMEDFDGEYYMCVQNLNDIRYNLASKFHPISGVDDISRVISEFYKSLND